jgi:hypothetical protein
MGKKDGRAVRLGEGGRHRIIFLFRLVAREKLVFGAQKSMKKWKEEKTKPTQD